MNSKPHNLLFAFSPWAFVFIFLVHGAIISSNPLQVTEQLCDKDLFGTPNVDDCYHAMFWIPYMNSPAKQSPAATANRLFAEPQHLDPPFSAVKNKWAPNAIVQLPRIWKFGTSPQCPKARISICPPVIHRRISSSNPEHHGCRFMPNSIGTPALRQVLSSASAGEA